MKQIRIEGLSRHFGRHIALHKIRTTLRAGEITGLLGANGAGKTTLLNILAGTEEPTAGTVHYDTWSWQQMARHGRHQIGWVSHAPMVYHDLTGIENLLFFANMYQLPDAKKRCEAWLDRVGLTHAMHQRVESYSRGMLQRLTIARALLHDPSLLLLDEPLTGLDRAARTLIGELFTQQRERQRLLLMSTHDLQALAEIAQRIIILRRGQIAYDGPSAESAALIALYEEHSA